MRDVLIVACYTLAAGAAGYLAVQVFAAVSRRRATAHAPDGPAPTAPDEPDTADEPQRDESGADEEYGDDLHERAWWEDQLSRLVEDMAAAADDDDVPINLLDPELREAAEGGLAVRLAVTEQQVHFADRMSELDDWLDRWAGDGWWDEPETLPEVQSFAGLRALVTDTGEISRDELNAMLAGAR